MMKQILKKVVENMPLYYRYYNYTCAKRQKKELLLWENNGKPMPPPHLVKQKILKYYVNKFDLKIFIETGTCYGDMIEAMKNEFESFYSIELSELFYRKSAIRFRSNRNIHILQGDSGIILGEIMAKIDKPSLFWLDGHYSGGDTAKGECETPIYKELEHIFNGSVLSHVILVDDARFFGTNPAYPKIKELKEFVFSKSENVDFEVKDDCIRITPKLT